MLSGWASCCSQSSQAAGRPTTRTRLSRSPCPTRDRRCGSPAPSATCTPVSTPEATNRSIAPSSPQMGSARREGGVVDDEGGLEAGVFGGGELDGDALAFVGGDVEALLGIAGVGVEVRPGVEAGQDAAAGVED